MAKSTQPIAAADDRVRPQLIRRRVAARIAGWSLPTLRRRELADPAIPARIATGPNGGPPYGYRLADWQRYVDGLPAAPLQPSADASATAARARSGKGRRNTPSGPENGPVAAPAVAEGQGAAMLGENAQAARNYPQKRPRRSPEAPYDEARGDAAPVR